MNRLGNAVLQILILQRLGTAESGTYVLGVSYFIIGSRVAFLGLDHLLTREVSKRREEAGKYFTNFVFIRLVVAAISILLLLIFIQLASYSDKVRLVVFLMSLSIVPEVVNNLCWAVFAAAEEFKFTTHSVFMGSMVQLTVGIFLLLSGFGVVSMALVFLLNNIVAMVVNLSIVLRRHLRLERLDLSFLWQQLTIGLPFVFISVLYILDNRLDNIILSIVSTEEEIGLYGAATAIILAIGMIPQGYRTAILPVLSKYQESQMEKLRDLYERSFKYLLLLGLPIGVGGVLLARDIVLILYQRELPTAVLSLQIMLLTTFMVFVNVLNMRLLIVFNRQSVVAIILLVTATVNAFVNLKLSGELGAVGAAVARTVSTTILFLACLYFANHHVRLTYQNYLWRPLFASMVMGLMMFQVQNLGFGLVGRFIVGSLSYVVFLHLLGAFTAHEKAIALKYMSTKWQAIKRKSTRSK